MNEKRRMDKLHLHTKFLYKFVCMVNVYLNICLCTCTCLCVRSPKVDIFNSLVSFNHQLDIDIALSYLRNDS